MNLQAIMTGHERAERGKRRRARAVSHSMRSRAVRGIRADRDAAARASAAPPETCAEYRAETCANRTMCEIRRYGHSCAVCDVYHVSH